MKFNKKVGLILLVFTIIITSCIFSFNIEFNVNTNLKEERSELNEIEKDDLQKTADYWPNESPITINGIATGVGANNWTWALSQPWCNKVDDVYVIENVTINAAGADYGIEIFNSFFTKFVVRNCTIYNAEESGILLYYVRWGRLEENYCHDIVGRGIEMILCENITVYGNHLYNNRDDGIYMTFCKNNTIKKNCVYNNDGFGIQLFMGTTGLRNITHNLFIENTIYHNEYWGIAVNLEASGDAQINCSYNIFTNNNITDHMGWLGRGIAITAKVEGNSEIFFDHNELIKNNITETIEEGIMFDGEFGETATSASRIYCRFNNISENRLIKNGCDGISISSGSIYESSDGISYINNITMERNFISGMEDDGIALYEYLDEGSSVKLFHENITIKNNTIINTYEGEGYQSAIFINKFNSTTIIENNMMNCGVFLSKGKLNEYLSHRVKNNKVNNKPLIYITNKENLGAADFSNAGQIICINSNHSKIIELNVSKATIGITLFHCENFTLFNNTASDGYFGFLLHNSNENNISTNTANDNYYCGILLDTSNDNNITYNDFRRNPFCIVEFECSNNRKDGNQCDSPAGVRKSSDNGDNEKKEDNLLVAIILIIIIGTISAIAATSLYHYRSKNKTAKSIRKIRVKEANEMMSLS